MPAPPRGVIFDIDGTLLDSNRAHAEAWAEALQHFGFDVPTSRVQRLIGMGGDKLLPELIGVEINSEEGKKYAEYRADLFMREYFPSLRPFDGAKELATRLHGDDRTLVVASSAGKEEVEKFVSVIGISELLTDSTSADDAERSKPDPDVVLEAIRQSGRAASDLVMIGDTPYDVAAAIRAGVRMVGVRSGGWNDAELSGAVAVYDDVGAILEDYVHIFENS